MAEQEPKEKLKTLEVYWTTVTYRTVAILVLILLALGLGIYSLLRPGALRATLSRVATLLGSGETPSPAPPVQRVAQARFLNLDGEVRVRKANAVQWVNADYKMPLDEGDIVQTGANGVARITFVDGTNYVVKPETLIVIERNVAYENRATQVSVHVTSGAVDLSTGSFPAPGSRSTVLFENAVAEMRQNSRAAVKNDPKANVHEITVAEGQVDLQKGNERVTVGPYQRAGFTDPNASLGVERVLRPPQPKLPRNLQPIISTNPKQEEIRFEWSGVPDAIAYRLRIYTSPLLTRQVFERKNISETFFVAKGLNPGEYWWNLTAVDKEKQESAESETNKFSLHHQPVGEDLLLVIDNVIQHGRVIEVIGRTEPGATVIIQNEQVALVGPDGRFKHFTRPLPSAGAHMITITAQNQRGEVVTHRKQVYVQ